MWPVPLYPETNYWSAMLETIITLARAALAIWLLVDSAIEYVRDGQEQNTLATEP